MRNRTRYLLILMTLLLISACSTQPTHAVQATSTHTASGDSTLSNSTFTLTSSDVVEGGTLPKDYTCDGTSSTLPLSWSGTPAGTQGFAVIMHTVPGPGSTHWYWEVYNIPVSVTALPRNVKNIGTLGNNSVNGQTAYAPPCSKGPGPKIYTYTVYALSATPTITATPQAVSRDVLLAAVKDITLASATLNVTYSRP